jgi:hypothetical protein
VLSSGAMAMDALFGGRRAGRSDQGLQGSDRAGVEAGRKASLTRG